MRKLFRRGVPFERELRAFRNLTLQLAFVTFPFIMRAYRATWVRSQKPTPIAI